MILSDRDIRDLCQTDRPLIHPFIDSQNEDRPKGPSTGLTSYGYDLSLAPRLKLFPIATDTSVYELGKPPTIDPSKFEEVSDLLVDITPNEDGVLLLPPRGFALGSVNEYIIMPDNVVSFMFPKSTYARTGLQINAAPIEPGWEGEITLELYNPTGCNIALYPGQGIVQAVFLTGDVPEKTYVQRAGRYQGQTGITYPRG